MQISYLRTKKKVSGVLYQTAALVIGLIIIFPILYALSVSLMEPAQILTIPPSFFPKKATLENYKVALETTTLIRYMANSLLIAGVSSFARVITASLAAFAFSFFTFKGRNFLFMFSLGTIMIPADVVLVTNYKTVSALHLVNTYFGVMIVFCVSAMNIFMMRQYFLTFSKELKEAAYIDGCGNFRFFLRILMPLAKPVVTTVYISSFISTWNTYLWPMLVTRKNSMRTVQVGITMLNFTEGNTWGPVMAAACMVLIPAIVIFVIFQKKIVGGMMGGSLKG